MSFPLFSESHCPSPFSAFHIQKENWRIEVTPCYSATLKSQTCFSEVISHLCLQTPSEGKLSCPCSLPPLTFGGTGWVMVCAPSATGCPSQEMLLPHWCHMPFYFVTPVYTAWGGKKITFTAEWEIIERSQADSGFREYLVKTFNNSHCQNVWDCPNTCCFQSPV